MQNIVNIQYSNLETARHAVKRLKTIEAYLFGAAPEATKEAAEATKPYGVLPAIEHDLGLEMVEMQQLHDALSRIEKAFTIGEDPTIGLAR